MGHYSICVALCANYFYVEENLSYESLFLCHEIKKKKKGVSNCNFLSHNSASLLFISLLTLHREISLAQTDAEGLGTLSSLNGPPKKPFD